jgi:hypothetical protein
MPDLILFIEKDRSDQTDLRLHLNAVQAEWDKLRKAEQKLSEYSKVYLADSVNALENPTVQSAALILALTPEPSRNAIENHLRQWFLKEFSIWRSKVRPVPSKQKGSVFKRFLSSGDTPSLRTPFSEGFKYILNDDDAYELLKCYAEYKAEYRNPSHHRVGASEANLFFTILKYYYGAGENQLFKYDSKAIYVHKQFADGGLYRELNALRNIKDFQNRNDFLNECQWRVIDQDAPDDGVVLYKGRVPAYNRSQQTRSTINPSGFSIYVDEHHEQISMNDRIIASPPKSFAVLDCIWYALAELKSKSSEN